MSPASPAISRTAVQDGVGSSDAELSRVCCRSRIRRTVLPHRPFLGLCGSHQPARPRLACGLPSCAGLCPRGLTGGLSLGLPPAAPELTRCPRLPLPFSGRGPRGFRSTCSILFFKSENPEQYCNVTVCRGAGGRRVAVSLLVDFCRQLLPGWLRQMYAGKVGALSVFRPFDRHPDPLACSWMQKTQLKMTGREHECLYFTGQEFQTQGGFRSSEQLPATWSGPRGCPAACCHGHVVCAFVFITTNCSFWCHTQV